MRKLLGIVVSFSILAAATVAGAHNFSAFPSISIHRAPTGAVAPGTRVVVFGKIRTIRAFCRQNRGVRLFRVRPGPDRFLGFDLTDAEGEYRFIRRPFRDQTVYTRIRPRLHVSYGHRHSCASARSRNLFINVAGR